MDNTEVSELNKLLTVNEVVAILRVGHNKVYALIRSGKLPAFRLNGHGRKDKYNRKPWRIEEKDLAEFITAGSNVKKVVAKAGVASTVLI